MAVVTELVTKLSFKGSIAPLQKFNSSMKNSLFALSGMTAAFSASAFAMLKWTNGVLKGADALVQLSRLSGVGVENIQALGFAASVSGSSVQAMENTIRSLSKKIGDAALYGSEDFARLGISVRKSTGEVKKANEVFVEIAESFERMQLSPEQKISLASSIGVDESLVQLLSKSADEIDRLRLKALSMNIINKKGANQYADYKDAVAELKFGMEGLKRTIAIGLSPELKNLATSFNSFLGENSDAIINGISTITDLFVSFGKSIARVGGLIVDFSSEFTALSVTIGIVAAAFLVINAPIVAISLAIAAIILVVDDLIVAFKGGKSFIADFFAPLFSVQAVLGKTVAAFRFLASLGKKAFTSGARMGYQPPINTNGNRNNSQINNVEIYSNDANAVGAKVDSVINDGWQRQINDTGLQSGASGY